MHLTVGQLFIEILKLKEPFFNKTSKQYQKIHQDSFH